MSPKMLAVSLNLGYVRIHTTVIRLDYQLNRESTSLHVRGVVLRENLLNGETLLNVHNTPQVGEGQTKR